MSLQNYEMNDVLLVVVGIAGALSGLCISLNKSRCKHIKICFGCLDCDRNTESIIQEKRLEMGRPSGLTPRPLPPKTPIKLELNEPEPEAQPEPEPQPESESDNEILFTEKKSLN